MGRSTDCPDENILFQLASDALAEQDAEAIHLVMNRCESCQLVESNSCRAKLGLLIQQYQHWLAERPDSAPSLDATKAFFESSMGSSGDEGSDFEIFDRSMLAPSEDSAVLGCIGKYEIHGVLGTGGMGVVLKAFDRSLQRFVAIKLLGRQWASSPTARTRFSREGRAVAAISHLNVVTVYSVEHHEGLPFLVMELIEGSTLHDLIHAGERFDVVTTLRLGYQIALGLEAAHRHGVIHRDIKPGNIMIESGTGRVKITDFGLARIAMDNTDLTTQGGTLGTPAYMSPEQVRGEPIDARSDLFSLGCVLYAMLDGHSPFRGAHQLETAQNVDKKEPPDLSEIHDDVPFFISVLIGRLLDKDLDQRFQTASEVVHEFNNYLARFNQIDSNEFDSEIRRANQVATQRRDAKVHKPFVLGRRTRGAIIGAAVLLLVVALIYAGVYFWPRAPAPLPEVVLRTLTVSQEEDANADFLTLEEALREVRPGETIEVRDSRVHYGPYRIGEGKGRHRNISIITKQRAALAIREYDEGGETGDRPDFVVHIANTSGVRLEGFQVQHATRLRGVVVSNGGEGVQLVDLDIISNSDVRPAAIHITSGAAGSEQAPIRVEQCRIESGNLGIAIEERNARPVSHVQVINNVFTGANESTHIHLIKGSDHISVIGNRFEKGIGVKFNPGNKSTTWSNISIKHNTYWQNQYWLWCAQSLDGVIIANNLIIACQMQPDSNFHYDSSGLSMSDNVWISPEPLPRFAIGFSHPFSEVEFESSDSSHPDFMAVSVDSRAKLTRPVGYDAYLADVEVEDAGLTGTESE